MPFQLRSTARRALLAGGCLLALGAVVHSAPPGNRGTIVGQLRSAGPDKEAGKEAGKANLARKVVALHRASGNTFPGTIDPQTGAFSIGQLPLKGIYDCRIDFASGRLLEGINLNVPPSDYVEEQPLSEEDLETIKTKVRRMNKFEDVVEIKNISGNIQHAAILLNKLRTRPFFDSKPGEVIWRSELWHFERPEETWVKVQDELFVVLYRQRMQRTAYQAKSVTFDAALGGIRLTREAPQRDLGRVRLPLQKPGIHFRSAPQPAPLRTSSVSTDN
ncbi:MAG: hypothetical protein CMJ59_17620 [Planctomycetaceae bacterium]|nr:hypothetical protein [Planctomycetaceae bacterium]